MGGGRGRQSSRRTTIKKRTTKGGKRAVRLKEMISKKGMTKIRKRVAKLKEDDHHEADKQDHQEDDYHGRG